jgi:hypothetical protein
VTKVRVAGFSVSLDGLGAGPEQSLENPLGRRGPELHQWIFGTRMFRAMTGKGGGSDGVDETYAHRSMDGFGAFILGRNMFGPVRGPWPDESWKGWWGANPPYETPVDLMYHRLCRRSPMAPVSLLNARLSVGVFTNRLDARVGLQIVRRWPRSENPQVSRRPHQRRVSAVRGTWGSPEHSKFDPAEDRLD